MAILWLENQNKRKNHYDLQGYQINYINFVVFLYWKN